MQCDFDLAGLAELLFLGGQTWENTLLSRRREE